MSPLRRLTVVDQTAGHLREGLKAGRWRGALPGLRPLAAELGVSRPTLRLAMAKLQAEGLVKRPGPRENCEVTARATRAVKGRRLLRLAVLVPRGLENEAGHLRQILLRLLGELQGAGHTCTVVSLPAGSDPHKTGRLAQLVKSIPADAWIVNDGSHEVLMWFSRQKGFPVFALCGRAATLPIPSTGYYSMDALRAAVRRLVELGHRRIVYICPDTFLHPEPSGHILAFRDELAAAGISVGAYNTPEWEETPEGLAALLDSFFKLTPPTAFILWHGLHANGTLAFLASRGLKVPGDISLVMMEPDSSVTWSRPGMDLACFVKRHDTDILRLILRWVDSVAAGNPERGSRHFDSEFHPGNTIGPVKK